MQPKVELKGIREGLLVSLGDGEWKLVEEALLNQLKAQGNFLRGAKLILDVENHIIKAADLGSLRDTLSEMGITLWAVLTNSPTTETNAQALGMATRIHKPAHESRSQSSSNMDGDEAILIQRTIRSGNSINFDGHVVIIGDVNPGGEVIAGGNVVVWGKLRGMVHAGAAGNSGAVVCALVLSPTQLRIGDKIAVSPTEGDRLRPEMALVRDDRVVAEPWLND
jgi:septum site-determining protein MinC